IHRGTPWAGSIPPGVPHPGRCTCNQGRRMRLFGSAMNPSKVVRAQVARLTDLPNIGPSIAEDLRLLGYSTPQQLAGQDPYEMYDRINRITRTVHDPCLLDCFISVTRF